MAQIKVRHTGKGAARYTAVIRIKRNGVIVHQEARTFPKRALAEDWAKRREVDLASPGALENTRMGDVSIGGLVTRYIKEFEPIARWQKSKAKGLRRLLKFEIARVSAVSVTPERLVQHIRERLAGASGRRACTAATAGHDLSYLAKTFKAARGAWAVPAALESLRSARDTCRELGLIRDARKRDRTPTYDELKKLDAYFERGDQRSIIPMRHIMWFAIYSARRQDEICRILWTDNEEDGSIGVVRDHKHPREKMGNNRKFRYTEQGWAIVQMQPRGGTRVFPYRSASVSARWEAACRMLGIDNLRFHDLRHEAATRLFEAGLSIPEVATYTLHEDWKSLKRYTHILKRRKVLDAPFLPHPKAPGS